MPYLIFLYKGGVQMVEVHVPNKLYKGKIAGVLFENGVGQFEDEELAKTVANTLGYKLVGLEKPKATKKRATRTKAKDGE